MRLKPGPLLLSMLALGAAHTGCAVRVPPEALSITPQTVALRKMQSRRFATGDERLILGACVALLQDLEFNLEESSPDLGLIVASKDRSAVEAGQVIGAAFLAALSGHSVATDRNQRFRASVVTRPSEDRNSVIVRVTFQRTVWNTENQITRIEPLDHPENYQRFFEMLSKAVFLEANEF